MIRPAARLPELFDDGDDRPEMRKEDLSKRGADVGRRQGGEAEGSARCRGKVRAEGRAQQESRRGARAPCCQ